MGSAFSEPLRIAVAANFSPVLQQLQNDYAARCEVPWQLSTASSGQLHAQIINGAPFAVFLAADMQSVDNLPAGMVKDSRIYAEGKLALWFKNQRLADLAWQKNNQRMVIANPVTAPYGKAALAYLNALGVDSSVYVRANNIQQAYVMIDQGSVQGGFVALSALYLQGRPAAEYQIIESQGALQQKAALLVDNKTSRCFWQWLQAPVTQAQIQQAGYGVVP